jgi:hypothetical protein
MGSYAKESGHFAAIRTLVSSGAGYNVHSLTDFPRRYCWRISCPYIGQHSTRLRWPRRSAVLIFEGPSLSENAFANSSCNRGSVRDKDVCNCPAGSRSQARGGPEESVSDYLGCCATWTVSVSHKRWSVPSTVALSAEAGISESVYRENGISSRHFGWGDLGHGDSRSYQAHFLVQTLSWGIKEPPTLRFRREH